MRISFAAVLAASLVLDLSAPARADSNDLVLSRHGDIVDGDVIPRNQEFRSIASELGVAIAPPVLTTADTLGYSGFRFDFATSFTSISNQSYYWCATEQAAACGSGGFDRSSLIPTVGLFVRKGIWIPLPSFEIGAGITHVTSSDMWVGQTYAKFSLHEGFHDWPLPSLSVRGAVSRLMGSRQLDLTVAAVDVSLSYTLGVQGTFSAAVYGGGGYLWIVPRSEVIDKTPGTDGDVAMDFVFPTQDDITRTRLYLGLKGKYYVFSFIVEGIYTLAGTSIDNMPNTNTPCDDPAVAKNNCDAEDKSGAQLTISTSIGLDF
jgi:hypothetical protein